MISIPTILSAKAANNAFISATRYFDTKGVQADESRGLRNTRIGRYIGKNVHTHNAKMFQTGLQHGLDVNRQHSHTGLKLSRLAPLVDTHHHTAYYDLGHRLGAKYKFAPEHVKRQHITNFVSSLDSIENKHKLPYLSAIHEGAHRALSHKKAYLGARNMQEGSTKVRERRHRAASALASGVHKGVETLANAQHTLMYKAVPAAIKRAITDKAARALYNRAKASDKRSMIRRSGYITISPHLQSFDEVIHATRSLPREQRGKYVKQLLNVGRHFA